MTTATLPNTGNQDFVQQLRLETAAVRLMHGKFGVRRALSKAQVKQAAETFGAAGEYFSASKKRINTRHTAYKACTKIISQARCYWRTMTVPFPVKGIRLLRRDLLESFDETLCRYRDELLEATKGLQAVYADLRNEAREQLGDLFDPTDYPADIRDAFLLAWDYPSVEPPDHLKQLNPKLYELEQQKVAARLQEAIHLAEEAFAAELNQLVAHLVDRLSGDEDGQPKKFRESAVSNLTEFVARFQEMKVGNNAELDQLVERASQVVAGLDVADLRKDASLRLSIAEQMTKVKESLDGLIVERPIRHVELEDDE